MCYLHFPKGAACNLKSINRIGRRFDANTLHVITSIFQITARQAPQVQRHIKTSSCVAHCSKNVKNYPISRKYEFAIYVGSGSLHFKKGLLRTYTFDKSHPNSKRLIFNTPKKITRSTSGDLKISRGHS